MIRESQKSLQVFRRLRKIEPLLLRDVHMYPRMCKVDKKMLDFDIRWCQTTIRLEPEFMVSSQERPGDTYMLFEK